MKIGIISDIHGDLSALVTALDRLDANSPRLKDRLVVLLCTTNIPNMVDPAFLRRAGGTTEQFGRLTRHAFAAVLGKQLRDMPFRDDYGPQRQAERRHRDVIAADVARSVGRAGALEALPQQQVGEEIVAVAAKPGNRHVTCVKQGAEESGEEHHFGEDEPEHSLPKRFIDLLVVQAAPAFPDHIGKTRRCAVAAWMPSSGGRSEARQVRSFRGRVVLRVSCRRLDIKWASSGAVPPG